MAMVDGIASKAAIQQIDQLQKAQQPEKAAGVGKTGDGASFQEVMQRQEVQAAEQSKVAETQKVEATSDVKKSPAAQQLDKFVDSVGKDEAKIEAMMKRCVKGQTLSPQELLQLQSVMYGYSQKVELASKLVDKTTGGLKQIMNTQV
jgi:hypothetical protein